jgi:hypothetical protein
MLKMDRDRIEITIFVDKGIGEYLYSSLPPPPGGKGGKTRKKKEEQGNIKGKM